MTDQPKPEPRIDEHGVGICTIDCPIWKECMAACSITTDNRGVCLPWARQAAEALRAMEMVRQKKFFALERHGDYYHCWIADLIGKMITNPTTTDPVQAILKAAEAAAKGRKEVGDER